MAGRPIPPASDEGQVCSTLCVPYVQISRLSRDNGNSLRALIEQLSNAARTNEQYSYIPDGSVRICRRHMGCHSGPEARAAHTAVPEGTSCSVGRAYCTSRAARDV